MIKYPSITRKACTNRPNACLMGSGEWDLCSERISAGHRSPRRRMVSGGGTRRRAN